MIDVQKIGNYKRWQASKAYWKQNVKKKSGILLVSCSTSETHHIQNELHKALEKWFTAKMIRASHPIGLCQYLHCQCNIFSDDLISAELKHLLRVTRSSRRVIRWRILRADVTCWVMLQDVLSSCSRMHFKLHRNVSALQSCFSAVKCVY